jgi:plastocyanin
MNPAGRVLFAVIVCILGLLPPPTSATARSPGTPGNADRVFTTSVTVTMRQSKLTLSRRSVPAGAVAFHLVNRSKLTRDFRIAGKRSAPVKPGLKGILRVTLATPGRYAYVSTARGARATRGVLTVTGTPAPQPTTTVTVTATEFNFALSRQSVPAGTLIFTIANRGAISHNFSIAGKTSSIIDPDQTNTLTVVVTRAGSYPYLCTIPGHAEAGMKGVLTVT